MYPEQPNTPQQPQSGPQPGFPPQPPVEHPLPGQTPTSWQTPQPQQTYNQPVVPSTPTPPQPYNQGAQPAFNQGLPPQTPTPNQQFHDPYHSFQPPTPHKKNKMKLILIIAAAVIVGGVAVFLLFTGGKSLVSKFTGLELEKYTSTSFGFSLDVPKGWPPEEKNEEYYKDVTFEEPVGDVKDKSEANSNYANVHVTYNLADQEYLEQTEQEYFDGIKKSLQQAISEQEEETGTDTGYEKEHGTIESEGMGNVNGMNVYRVKLKITNYEGKKDEVGYAYGMFVFVDNKTQYEVSISAHESESVNAKADAILDSFTRP